ncbi:MAG: cyanophycinase [Burkholderiaceae bacterium]|nr:cyanophycinase [Burkholderiaceae bacterium]
MNESTRSGRQGTLLIIGGHEDKKGERLILKELAQRARGGSLLVATLASHNRVDELWDIYSRQFRELGVDDVVHFHIDGRAQANAAENVTLLDRARVVFFTGGDQLKITSDLAGTELCERLLRFYREDGGTIAGTSAGAAVMPETMLVSGRGGESHRIGDRLSMSPGLGKIKGVIVDQHFAERGRLGRLLAAVAQNPSALGIGIDEDTAILVEGNDEFRVIGDGAVYVLDGQGITYTNVADRARETTLAVSNMRLHALSHGHAFNLQQRVPLEAASTSPLLEPN